MSRRTGSASSVEVQHAAAAVSLIPGLGNSGPTSKHVSLKFLPQFCTSFLSPDSSSVPGIFTSTVVPTSLQKAPSCMHPLTTCIDNIEKSMFDSCSITGNTIHNLQGNTRHMKHISSSCYALPLQVRRFFLQF